MLTCIRDWVVALVLRNVDTVSVLAGQNVERAVALVVNVLRAHQSSHSAVSVVLLQLLPIVVLVVVQIEEVVCRASLILLSCIELVSFRLKDLSVLYITSLHVFKPADLTGVPFFAQVSPFVLYLLVFLLTDPLVSH